MRKVRIDIPLTDRQKRMLVHPARVLHIGCGTKTGKSFGLASWIVEGILNGEATAWCGPWFARTRSAWETICRLLKPMIDSGEVKATEGILRLRHASSGGSLDCYSADNPQSLFGGNYDRVVLDEASRMPEQIYAAAITTISATNGKLRCAFNLELGSKNWAIRNLLRVQGMTAAERIQAGEDFLTFPTGGDGLVPQALIDTLRSQMPEQLWRALYLAEIPESDTSLFRNLDKIFGGQELDGPLAGHDYVAGIDLARKRDFTVVTVMDSETGAVVAMDRFSEISWTLQCERAALLCKKFRCTKAHCDATGLGDPVSEALSQLGVAVEPFIFSTPSRKALLEKLILACDNLEISLPATEKFLVYKSEMAAFEYALDGTMVRYGAPSNMHDDCVMSLALAVHGKAAGGLWALLTLAKDRLWNGFVGTWKSREPEIPPPSEPAPTVVLPSGETRVEGGRAWLSTNPPCESCGSTCTVHLSGMLHCNMCGHDRYPNGRPAVSATNRTDYLGKTSRFIVDEYSTSPRSVRYESPWRTK